MKKVAQRNFFVLAFPVICVSACTISPPVQSAAPQAQTSGPSIVGNDRDAHGCIASAGYVWSSSRELCVRLWEVETKLNDGANPKERWAGTLIENGAAGDMEIFLPSATDDNSLVLQKSGNVWRDSGNNYSISKTAEAIITLSDKTGKIIAQSQMP